MSRDRSTYVFAFAPTANYDLRTRPEANAQWRLPGEGVTEPYALFLGADNDGLVVEGDLEDIFVYMEMAYHHVKTEYESQQRRKGYEL